MEKELYFYFDLFVLKKVYLLAFSLKIIFVGITVFLKKKKNDILIHFIPVTPYSKATNLHYRRLKSHTLLVLCNN